MRMIRIFFDKIGESAYISHLDLQRVMARALRKSGLPVWYSKGFNPHIYMSFSLPLPLGQESFAESVDCKTEAEEDLSCYLSALNDALPRGIVAKAIAEPQNKSGAIRWAQYRFTYAQKPQCVQNALQCFEKAEIAQVLLKRKKTQEQIDLKQHVKELVYTGENTIMALLPAGNEGSINPQLFVSFLEEHCGLSQKGVGIQRLKVLMDEGQEYC